MSETKAFLYTLLVTFLMMALDALFHRDGASTAMAMYALYLGFRAYREGEAL